MRSMKSKLGLGLVALGLLAASPAAAEVYLWVMQASEDQVNNSGVGDGSTDSGATGLGVLVYDTATGELGYFVNWAALEGDLTAIHVHGPAGPGMSTVPHIFNVFTGEQDVIDAGVDRTTGQTTDTVLFETAVLDTQSPFDHGVNLRFMLEERGYVNIHTDTWPKGEIRADLVLVQGELVRTGAQRRCTKKINKRFRVTSDAQAELIARCLRDGAMGVLAGTVEECIADDEDRSVDAAEDRTEVVLENRCWGVDGDGIHKYPFFGAPDGGIPGENFSTTIDVVNRAALEKEVAVARGILSDPLDDSVISKQADPDGELCQRKVYKRTRLCQQALVEEFNLCKRNGIRGGRSDEVYEGADDPFDDASDLEPCLGFDLSGRIAQACGSDLDDVIAKHCDASVDLAAAFPGCGEAAAGDLVECIDETVRCEVCTSLNTVDGMSAECDSCPDE